MRIAVPLFKDRISPHFCTSAEILLADIVGRKITDERKAYWEELVPSEKIEKLKRWGVDVLLCGGIAAFNKRKIKSLGIEVVSELRGKAKEILEQWLRQFPAGNSHRGNYTKTMFQGNVN